MPGIPGFGGGGMQNPAKVENSSALDEDGYETIEVRQPLAGLYDQGNIFAIPNEGLTKALNVTLSSLALEKRPGRVQVGEKLDDVASPPEALLTCHWGYQHVTKCSRDILRVNGQYLMKLINSDPSPANWTWKGAVSGTNPPTAADIIGNGVNLGTAVQKAQRIHYADGGALRRMYEPSDCGSPPSAPKILPWGSILDPLPAPTILDTPALLGGNLTDNRRYSMKYQLIDPDTGFKTSASLVSNVSVLLGVNSPPNTTMLPFTIPAIPTWTPNWSILRVFRSPGAVDPSVPASWKFEMDHEGIARLDIYGHIGGLLRIPDGDLGDLIDEPSGMIPPCRYVLYDPQGDRVVAFGDKDNPNVVYWSEDGNFGNFPTKNQTPPIEDNYGDPLTGGAVLRGRIYLMKQRGGIFVATPDSIGSYSIDKITNAVGCVSFHSIVNRGTRLYWLSFEGAIEFAGDSPVNISDQKIRNLMQRLATSNLYEECYGIEERKSGSQNIIWNVIDPADGLAYHLVFDLSLRAWTIHLAGVGEDAAGGTDRVMWNVLDDDDGDNAMHVYTGDRTGRCFRLGTDTFGAEVWDDNGHDYTFDGRTPWFGNGIDCYVPRYMDFLLAIAPSGVTNGKVRVGLYVDGEPDEKHFREYVIKDSNSSPRLYLRRRFRCDSKRSPCGMFQFAITHTFGGGAVKIPWYQIKLSREERPPRGEEFGE